MTEYRGEFAKLYLDRNLQIIFGVSLMVVMGVSSITPAFPRMMRELSITAEAVGMVVTVFTIPGVLLTPVLGVLADRWGRKRILGPSLLLFGVAGFACSFAPDFQTLLALRFLQGVGAAALGALNLTIVGDLYSGSRRADALGLNATALSLGVAAYPVIGGGLAMLGWRYPFLLPLTAVPLGFIVLFALKNPEPERSGVSLGRYLSDTLRVLKSRSVLGVMLSTMLTFVILYGPVLTFLPVLLSERYGASSAVIGAVLSCAALVIGLASSQVGKLTRRFGEANLIRAGFALYALSMAAMLAAPSLWWFPLPVLLYGAGQGLNMPSAQALLTAAAPLGNRAGFMAVNGMALRLGQTLGPALMALVYGWFGLDGVYWAGGVVAVSGLAVVVRWVRPG